MRIGVNGRFLTRPPLEGIGNYTYHILYHLIRIKSSDDQIFVFYDRQPDKKFLFDGAVVPVVLKPKARHFLAWMYFFESSINNALKKYEIDVFFSPDGHLSLRSEIRSVITVHDLVFERYPEFNRFDSRLYYKFFYKKFCKKSDRIIAISNATKNDIIDFYSVLPEKIEVVYNGVDNEFKPLSEDRQKSIRQKYTSNNPYFIYVGSIHPRKNIARLVTAYGQFRDANPNLEHRLMIVGRFAWKSNNEKAAIRHSKYRNDIIHLSNIKSAIYDLVGSAEVLLYTSLYEGFGLPILEALACGVPVITSNVSAMKEVGKNHAILIDPYQVDQLASALESIVYKKVPLQKNEWISYAHSYSWEKAAAQVYRILTVQVS